MIVSHRFEHLFLCAGGLLALYAAVLMLKMLCWYIRQPEFFATLTHSL